MDPLSAIQIVKAAFVGVDLLLTVQVLAATEVVPVVIGPLFFCLTWHFHIWSGVPGMMHWMLVTKLQQSMVTS